MTLLVDTTVLTLLCCHYWVALLRPNRFHSPILSFGQPLAQVHLPTNVGPRIVGGLFVASSLEGRVVFASVETTAAQPERPVRSLRRRVLSTV